uniref:Uncharacterized protein n=1 Tax=Lactuca sativa TaxID=4236 RepID=A0A9R1VAN2_LACSA|nr:hypothetical protein LSAT_V11C600305460 [Lactuca sativa]
MEKQHQTRIISHVLIIIIIIFLSFASFALCIICEFKKSKEIRVDGKLCYLPQSRAFAYGIAALICSFIAQVIGTGFFILCRRSADFKSSKSSFASIILCLSW